MSTLIKFLNLPQVQLLHLLFWLCVNLIQWGHREELTKVEWASWVQAIGSVAAITFAYAIGRQQAKATLQSVRDADKIAAQRKFDSVLAVADSARNYVHEIAKAFAENEASYLHLELKYREKLFQNMQDALQVIPAHDLGSYHAVSAMLTLRNAMHDFLTNVRRAQANFEATRTEENAIEPVISFSKTPINLCLRKIDECVKALRDERPSLP